MIERTLAKRYAAALLHITNPEGSTDEVESFLMALKEAYLRQKDFRALLDSPRVPRAVKKALLRKMFESHAQKSFLDFLELLVDKDRTGVIPEIADQFDWLSDASRGLARLKVRSWQPLSEGHRARLIESLTRLMGKRVEIEAETDPALKGGLVVTLGHLVLDGSVAYRLKGIGERLRELQSG